MDAGSANVTESAAAAATGARRSGSEEDEEEEVDEEEGRKGGPNTADEAGASTALIVDSVKTIAAADVVVAVVDKGVSPCGEITETLLFPLVLDIGD